MSNRLSRRLLGVTIAALSVLGVSACGAQTTVHAKLAANTTRPIHIVSDVHIRPTPDTSQSWLANMPAGSDPTYICYVDSQNVGGTTKWFHVSWNGVNGYYSSIADDVPLSAQGNLEGNYGIPRCGTGTDVNQGSGSDGAIAVQPFGYDRGRAATYALDHAQDHRDNLFPDCTWFASQVLWDGGFPQSDTWNGYGHHGQLGRLPGTATATAAPMLVDYLVRMGYAKTTNLSLNNNPVPEAQPGDIIAYTWDPKNHPGIDHLAVVVDITPGQYPEVSEWGTASPREPYQKRGWTWSELNHKWLQEEYPNVTAQLIHINR
jgi:hypothetical protein